MKANADLNTREVTLVMSFEEAALLHAFLGEHSSDEFTTKALVAVQNEHGTFLPIDFPVKQFENNMRTNGQSYYFDLDDALQSIATP